MLTEVGDLMTVPTQETAMPKTYRQIADDILDRIHRGELKPGDPLPSYRELAKQHGVGVSTASKAYSILHALGAITSEQGRGVYVAKPSPRS